MAVSCERCDRLERGPHVQAGEPLHRLAPGEEGQIDAQRFDRFEQAPLAGTAGVDVYRIWVHGSRRCKWQAYGSIGCRCLAPRTWSVVLSTQYVVLSTQYLVPLRAGYTDPA